MKQILKAGWLVMAAALSMGIAACSGDDNSIAGADPQVATPQAVSTVHVTVGAGIGDDGDGQTRSDVTDDGGKRRLVFTEGDKLFVFASVTADNNYFLAGTLSIGAITDGGRTASFSGDLQVYHFESGTPVPSTYTFTDPDPLNECTEHDAYLIAKDMAAGCYTIEDYWYFQLDYTKSIAVDDPEDDSDDCVSTLMKTALKVESYKSYGTESVGDEGPKMFRYFRGDPILICDISGLTSGTAYTVTALGDYDEGDYDSYSGSRYNVRFATTVTATSDGKARFAISLESSDAVSNYYWTLKFEGGGETRYVKLGRKEMWTNKVYRVSRTATAG